MLAKDLTGELAGERVADGRERTARGHHAKGEHKVESSGRGWGPGGMA